MKKKLLHHILLACLLGGLYNPIYLLGLDLNENPFTPSYILNDTIPANNPKHLGNKGYNPFELKMPVEESWEYNSKSNSYQKVQKLGDDYFSAPSNVTFNEFLEERAQQQEKSYFGKLSGIRTGEKEEATGSIDDPALKYNFPNDLLARLFGQDENGETNISIKPRGNLDLKLGGTYQNIENPTLTLRQRRQFQPLFDMGINVNVAGQIGEKLKLTTNYNTRATFNFDNNVNLDYDGLSFGGDEIIRDIQAGDISLPLRSNLIQGVQSLFGIRADMQFGKLKVTTVLSQQRSERKDLVVQGGKQIQDFEIKVDQYDVNRHFFLTHYNRDHYEQSLEDLPQLNSLFKIQNIEVWITNDRNETEGGIREIVALTDIGEPRVISNKYPDFQVQPARDIRDFGGDALPHNSANGLYDAIQDTLQPVRRLDRSISVLQSQFGLQQGVHFDKVRARKLKPTEFTVNTDLGFISLNVNVQPDQVVGVAFEYNYNGRTFRVGEFSQDVPDVNNNGDPTVLFVKMMKSSITRIDNPIWDLMMKNVYSLGAYQVNQEDFELDVYYDEPGFGIKRFLPEPEISNLPIIRLFNLDDLNSRGDRIPDGKFDFVAGSTILPSNGRLIFPVLEPFNDNLVESLTEAGVAPERAELYRYPQLYDSTVTIAREFNELNRFTIKGRYLSSISNEITLNSFNLPPGSIRVTGAQPMVEGVDYEVDYNLGRVRILNDAILNSGVPIRVSYEDESLFGFTSQSLLGIRADYEVNEDFQIGGTFLNMRERPFSNKVNIGDDPINNRIYGVDVNFNQDAPFLTKMVDAIPGISTKAPSRITFTGEAAYLQPGYFRAIGANGGTVFLEDFEGSTSNLPLKTFTAWQLAATPQNDESNNNPLFPESGEFNSLINGANRGKLAWYQLEIDLNRVGCDALNPYCAPVSLQEIFTEARPGDGNLANQVLNTFNVYFDPEVPGPYNYDVPSGYPGYTAGLDNNGFLRNPKSRWGGISRGLAANNDFEQANYEFIEFWMLDPFLDEGGSLAEGGDIYFNLGNVSEDVLRDSRQAFEAGLPNTQNQNRPVDTTTLGVVPIAPPINNGFGTDNILDMDLGLDGIGNADEQILFQEYLSAIDAGVTNTAVRNAIFNDPSKDDFVHFADAGAASVEENYLSFNNPQGNTSGDGGDIGTRLPDSEELNGDNTLNELEAYYQYKVSLQNGQIENSPYVVDKIDTTLSNGLRRVWYRFKVPISQYDKAVGGISDFRSIRFIRMYMTNWDRPVNLRFATLDLVRSNWRRYARNLRERTVAPQTDGTDNTLFEVFDVNLEENSKKQPFPYVIPPGTIRELQITNFNNAFQNEQSMGVTVCGLRDGDARGIYKIINYDLRLFDSLTMFVHGEQVEDQPLEEGDMNVFIRFGSDFQNNYYEYEYPLVPSDPSLVSGLDVDPEVVWPNNNRLSVALRDLVNLKVERDIAGFAPSELFELIQNERIFRVKGNPNLGLVNGIMVGVRNPQDNGTPHCAEVWFNELAAVGIDNKGGGAALARMDMQLADFGSVSLSGNFSSIGWGKINESLNERAREQVLEFDASASLNLDKFLPEETGIKIPFFAQYSNSTTTPQFDPYDFDIELKDKLDRAEPSNRDSLRQQAQKITTLQTIAFTNVRKERTNLERKPMPWDIENLSFSYAYTKSNYSDPIIAFDEKEQHKAQVSYNFNTQPKFIKPFNKLIKKEKTFDLFKDFNFNLYPTNLTVNSQVNRQEGRVHYRFTGESNRLNTYFDNRFTWDRNYGVTWPFTESLSFNFAATARAVVDEIPLNLNAEAGRRQEFLNGNVRDFGRLKDYNHTMNLNYELPFGKIPILSWIRGTAQYNSSYNWTAGVYDTERVFNSPDFNEALGFNPLGNIIQNNMGVQGNLDLNFTQLYRKSDYLSKVYNYRSKSKASKSSGRNRSSNKPGADEEEDDKKKDKKKGSGPSNQMAQLLRPLLALKSAKVTYTEDYSTVLPGFAPQADLLGMSSGFDAPGWDFIFGLQPGDAFKQRAIDNNWIVDTVLLNQEFVQTESEKLNVRVSLEPVRSLTIDLNAERSISRSYSELFKNLKGTFLYDNNGAVLRDADGALRFYEDNQVGVIRTSFRERGQFSMTYFSARTLFRNDNEVNDMFDQTFKGYRATISQRLGMEDPTVNAPHAEDSKFGDYVERYGRFQNEVLIPSFLAAYTGTSPNSAPLTLNNLLASIPKPNWRLSYSGLSNIPALKEIFSSVRINHRYQSTLTINDFNNDLNYINDTTGLRNVNSVTQNYFAQYEIPAIQIQEAFSPLIGLDVKTKGGLDLGLEMGRKRNLNMNFNDYQLAETRSTDYSARIGYRIKDVYVPFLKEMFDPKDKKGARKKVRSKRSADDSKDKKPKHPNSSDININLDFSYGDNVTLNHQLDENGGVEPTRGTTTFKFAPTVDYDITKQLNVQMFFDYERTEPKTTNAIPITRMSGGFNLRFSLN